MAKNSKKLVLTALMIALTYIGTIMIQIPSPMNGYVNLGDCFVLLSAWILGPVWGAAAAGIGSAMADVLTGYSYYAPGTLVIKTGMALTASFLFRLLTLGTPSLRRTYLARLTGAAAAEVLMVAGYFGYACLLLGEGLAAAASIPGNVVQGIFGIAASLALISLLERSGALKYAAPESR